MDARLSNIPGTAGGWLARLVWVAVFVALLAAQAYMALGLFGADRDWRRVLDAEPILSGRHPLHLYHGFLGARAFLERGQLCCYDPAFQAGYPKTPVFDGGSRPAELFLALTGAGYRPEVYKIGLLVCCLLAPLLLALAAWGAGLGPGGICLSSALGLLVCWSEPCRDLWLAGDVDLLFAGLAALLYAGMLARFDRVPGPLAWFGLVVGGALGWFAMPLLFGVIVAPLLLLYYLSTGIRHGLFWHGMLLAAVAGGLAANAFWLPDWVAYWWMLNPLHGNPESLPPLTWRQLWTAPLWGELPDRILAATLLGLGILGLGVFHYGKRRVSARLLGLGGGGLLVLAVAGMVSEPLEDLGSARLLTPALWFATLPAAASLVWAFALLARLTGATWRAAGIITVTVAATAVLTMPLLSPVATLIQDMETLQIGLGEEKQHLVETVSAATATDARILWEDRLPGVQPSRWTALLPLLTGRTFLGGLDPETLVEYGQAALVAGQLAGRPIGAWTDSELEAFCRRYNLGWVVCWSPESVARFQAWKMAEALTEVVEGVQPGKLFQLRRPRSFVLKGQARWLSADGRHISLGDVVPDGDEVILSLHYQAGLTVLPSRVRIEPLPDIDDPIPLVRLRLPGPVTRITLTWQDP